MSHVVPSDGVYRIQNVAYPEQYIGLSLIHDVIQVVGRREGSVDPHIEWEIKTTSVGDHSRITMKSGSRYIGVAYTHVVYDDTTPYEWDISYREDGGWVLLNVSGFSLVLYLPDGYEETKVQLTSDGAGAMSYWRFIPVSPPSN
ncbi:hypothetical protein BDR04DRAFT_1086436 [Suillus decipiens]|nr:hypothetical protein BDR04DRAFT_1086436 [Suillus decipiens]